MVDSGSGNRRCRPCAFALSNLVEPGLVSPDRPGRLGDPQTRRAIRIALRVAKTPFPKFLDKTTQLSSLLPSSGRAAWIPVMAAALVR